MLGALLVSPSALGFDAESLHQNHCAGCHARITGGEGEVLYRGDRGTVRELEQLHARINHCQRGVPLQWTEEEISAMRTYLNAHYYAFPPTD